MPEQFTPSEAELRSAYFTEFLPVQFALMARGDTNEAIEARLDAEFARAIAKIKADAWEEGYESGRDDEAHDARGIGRHDYAENPYLS